MPPNPAPYDETATSVLGGVRTIKFFVAGIPMSRGSKRAFPFKKKNGKLGVAVSDNNPKSKDWMVTVAYAAEGELVDARDKGWSLEDARTAFFGPIGLRLTFIMPRPKSHFYHRRTGSVIREDAPKYHTSKPDRGKLARAVEDALTGIAYLDDSQVCAGPIEKVYGDRPGVEIELTPMGPQPN
jgi:Holliday junction resolvase RusA-like endonuclease